jgi:hypothetical protein
MTMAYKTHGLLGPPVFDTASISRCSLALSTECCWLRVCSQRSLYHAMVMGHPYNPGTTLIDYSTMTILTPAMLVGIKAGRRMSAFASATKHDTLHSSSSLGQMHAPLTYLVAKGSVCALS